MPVYLHIGICVYDSTFFPVNFARPIRISEYYTHVRGQLDNAYRPRRLTPQRVDNIGVYKNVRYDCLYILYTYAAAAVYMLNRIPFKRQFLYSSTGSGIAQQCTRYYIFYTRSERMIII